nr:zinc finger CCCH domain-containing protein 13-like [Lytechinus pictus]
MPRKVTVDSSKSVRDSTSDSRRPSVFERLGPGGTTSHSSKQDHYGKWEGEGSKSYRDHYSHGDGSDSIDLRHRVESKRAEKERDRDGSRDRSRGHRSPSPSPSGKRDRSKHRGSHKEHEGSERKKKNREPSSLVVKGGRRSPESNHGDTDEWKGYDNAPSDDDPLSDEYGLEQQRRELQRQLAQIDHGGMVDDSGAEYPQVLSSRSPSPVRKKVPHTKKSKKRDRSGSKIRSRSPPHRSVSPVLEKKNKKKISPGKRDAYPPLKKKKRVSLSPARRGPRTPSLSPSPKKLKVKDIKKKKGSVPPKKVFQKKRVSSSESSSSSSGSDSSSSGSSGSSSSSDSEEEYVKKKKSPVILGKKKPAPVAQHHHQPQPIRAPVVHPHRPNLNPSPHHQNPGAIHRPPQLDQTRLSRLHLNPP